MNWLKCEEFFAHNLNWILPGLAISMLSDKLQQYQAYAAFTFEADGLVSVVLSKDDLKAIQQKAIEAGISY